MAVPSKPAAQSAGGTATASWTDDVRDLLGWFRDDRPIFKGKAWTNVAHAGDTYGVNTATNTTAGFGTAGAFKDTPDINVGGWTVNAADADPESLVVPEAGIYLVSVHTRWEADATGIRQARLLVNGSSPGGGQFSIIGAASATATTDINNMMIVDVAASADLDVELYQTSGSTLTCTVYLTAIWMQST